MFRPSETACGALSEREGVYKEQWPSLRDNRLCLQGLCRLLCKSVPAVFLIASACICTGKRRRKGVNSVSAMPVVPLWFLCCAKHEKSEPSSSLLSGGYTAEGCTHVCSGASYAGSEGLPEKVKLNYVFTCPAWRQVKEMLCGVLFSIKFRFTISFQTA